MKYVGINPSGGGSDIGVSGNGIIEKNYTLELAKKIKSILDTTDINCYLTRTSDTTINYNDRIEELKKVIPKKSLLISLTLSTNNLFEVIYSLNKDDMLASTFKDALSNVYETEYYQMRLPSDTTKDYYLFMRNTNEYETIIIRLGNPSNSSIAEILKEKKDELAELISDVIINKLGGVKSNDDYYIVKSGDTLWSIAKKFNMSVDELKTINNLKSNLITINQRLKVKRAKSYVVKKGDTLWDIAKNNNTTVNEIKRINNLKSDLLSIGKVLYLP